MNLTTSHPTPSDFIRQKNGWYDTRHNSNSIQLVAFDILSNCVSQALQCTFQFFNIGENAENKMIDI